MTANFQSGALRARRGGHNPRQVRLAIEYTNLMNLAARSDLIAVEALDVHPGWPPEKYLITYRCRGIVGIEPDGAPKYGDFHQVKMYLPSDYPLREPHLKWMTPIWHPNINHLNGSVCIDAAWWTASRSLDRLVIMLGEMLQWKNFHDDPTKPPFPWDADAARWSREYRKKNPDAFPLDQRELMRPERVKLTSSGAEAAPKISLFEKAKSKIKLK